MKKQKYDGKPLVAEVKILEIPCNPNDLSEGCKTVPLQLPAEEKK